MRPAAWLSGGRRERAALLWEAAVTLGRDQLRREWAGSAPHRWLISRPKPHGLAAAPTDLRPGRPSWGHALLDGRFVFDGLVLETGPGGDPWNRPAPSRAFAVALHGMDWLPDLLCAPGGARAALSLALGWQAVFGQWNSFSWSGAALERRVFNLACAARPLVLQASPAETEALLDSLARQARHLLLAGGSDARSVERAAAAATAGCALAGPAGEGLLDRALPDLERRLPQAVLPDGGHASRSAEIGKVLLFDLRTLDHALEQRGRAAPDTLSRAIDRLAGALPGLVLADGRLPALQGSEMGDPVRIAAALAGGRQPAPADLAMPRAGYHRLTADALQLLVDVGAPATGAWSVTACAQPLAIEVLADRARLITASAWSPRADGAQALRLTPAASTASVSDSSCGRPLTGRLARRLGHRLQGALRVVSVRRHDSEAASWLDLSHDGWAETFGLTHGRRLYLDRQADELRGEDQLTPAGEGPAPPSRRPPSLVVRFQLHPDVKASLALDQQSVLLQPKGGRGWWLRNDAPQVAIEPGVHLEDGRPRHASQVVMKRPLGPDRTARIRWKLGLGS